MSRSKYKCIKFNTLATIRSTIIFWQKIIFNSIVANLTVISNANDTVVLYDYVGLTYYALNSQYMYTGSSLSTLYSLNQYLGSWILVYYSAGIGNFSFFFNRYCLKI